MERRQIGLKLVLDGLGLPVKLETFDDRLILQKAVYLAQAAGINLGYFYRWYLHGPYCPALADDAFAVRIELVQGIDEAAGWALDASSSDRLAPVRTTMGSRREKELARRLELLASVHFLVDRRQVVGRDPQAITETLRRFGKSFGTQDVEQALGEMAGNGILP